MSAKTKTSSSKTFGFRVVVRGLLGDKRVRRVRTIHAKDEASAVAVAEKEDKLVSGLKNLYMTVLPPLE